MKSHGGLLGITGCQGARANERLGFTPQDESYRKRTQFPETTGATPGADRVKLRYNRLVLRIAIDRRDGTRGALTLCGAVVLHAAFTLFAWDSRAARAPAAVEPAGTELGLVPIALEPPRPAAGAPPGGGAPEPAPTSRTAPARRSVRHASEAAPRVSTTPSEPKALPAEAPVMTTPLVAPATAADLVSQASNHAVAANLSARTLASARVAPSESALGPYPGAGPGSRSGPGGPGAGYGTGSARLARTFAFGGPSGAFRAEVCFIPETTQSLRQIRGCKTEVTFFTDHLDVPPRAFTEGFPGISARTEWFAIYYRGKFKVERADYFTFHLISDDGSLLYVDGHLIIDNDKRHPPASKRATVPLAVGEHLLNVEYYQGPRDRIALQLFVAGSDGHEKLFGPVL
ncbi:MAG TPA: PA14 domain-containing protein [Polyangiaceae bacterium]|nr:PA14 domain-containing protein [Polyangiaceae bacterium]